MNFTLPEQYSSMEELALTVRKLCVSLATDGGCFLGASLSCVDILVYLYTSYLNISPQTVHSENRDYFFLSKGHDVPALYGLFASLGFINKERLSNHLTVKDSVYWHPNRNIPGVEFHSGSLGHLLSVACGTALSLIHDEKTNKVVVLLGDGETNEGSVWEALLVASAYKLNNLTIVIDRNNFQANMPTEQLIPLEPMEDKFLAFGCSVVRCNGHDFNQLHSAFILTTGEASGPKVIICDTVRGKGLPSIEARADRWFCNFSHSEITELLQELEGSSSANLTSETLVVR